MKIICTQENLKAGLQTASRVITNSATLPILGSMHLKTDNGLLVISATNLEIGIQTSVRGKVEEDGAIALPAKPFIELVNSLPRKPITLETGEGFVSIKTDNYHTKLKSLPAEDFPVIPQPENGVDVKFTAPELKHAIDRVLFASSPNENQPEIAGVYMAGKPDGVVLVATDRYRLAECMVIKPDSTEFEGAIIPYRAIAEIARIVGSDGENVVNIIIAPNQLSLKIGETQVITRLIEGNFPPYESIIPVSFETEVTVEREGLVNALKTTSVFASGIISASLDFRSEERRLQVTSGSQDLGESEVLLPAEITGQPIKVLINIRYLLDCLSILTDPKVTFKLNSPSTAILIVPEGRQDFLYLVQPIKT